MLQLTQTAQTEFWFHVANQDEIPIFGTVDKSLDIPLLLDILTNLPDVETAQKPYIREIIRKAERRIALI